MNNIKLEDLLKLGDKWLENKIQRMENLLKIAEPDEALYREIMLSLGYPQNKVQFLELALMLPYRELKELKEKDIIEKALLYRAGFCDCLNGLPQKFDSSLRMDKSVWKYKNIRPANFPDKRISGISYLLSQTIISGLVNYFLEKIFKEIKVLNNSKEAQKIVQSIIDFNGIGKQRKTEMFFNIILPFTMAYAKNENGKKELIDFVRSIFEIHPPLEENSKIKNFRKLIENDIEFEKLNISTKTYFGIIYLINNKTNSIH